MPNIAGMPAITEEQFQQQVLDLAHVYGWSVAHFRPAMTKWGWRTAVSGDGKGFPDTVLAKVYHLIIFAEIKRKGGKLTPEQEVWAVILKATPGVRYFIWWPEDFDAIQAILSEQA